MVSMGFNVGHFRKRSSSSGAAQLAESWAAKRRGWPAIVIFPWPETLLGARLIKELTLFFLYGCCRRLKKAGIE